MRYVTTTTWENADGTDYDVVLRGRNLNADGTGHAHRFGYAGKTRAKDFPWPIMKRPKAT